MTLLTKIDERSGGAPVDALAHEPLDDVRRLPEHDETGSRGGSSRQFVRYFGGVRRRQKPRWRPRKARRTESKGAESQIRHQTVLTRKRVILGPIVWMRVTEGQG
jgi:hypothetical protein